jgi:hypothetical protein
MILGELIKREIEAAKADPNKVAAYADMSTANLYRIYKKDSCESKYLVKIAEYLKIPVARFFPNDLSASNHSVTGDYSFNLQNTGHLKNRDLSNTHTPASAQTPDNVITQLEVCKKEVEGLKRENELLREMNELLKKRG